MSFISKFGISFNEKIDENVNEAFSNAPQRTGRALKQRQSLLRLSRNLLGLDVTDKRNFSKELDKHIFQREQPYLLFKWNVLHIGELALFLGLRAYYSVGHILLRTTLEGEMKGVFFNSLVKEEYRNQINPGNIETYGSPFQFSHLLRTLDKKASVIQKDSRQIFSIINETNSKNIYKIKPGSLRNILDSLDLLYPYTEKRIKKIYDRLSPYVHMHPQKGLSAQSVETEGHPFGYPQHTQDQLSKFLDLYGEILDVTGVLMLNEFKEYLEENRVIRNILVNKDYSLNSLKLTNTYRRLTNLCAYSEAIAKITQQIGEKPKLVVKNNNIVEIYLQNTEISDPSPFQGLKNLRKLFLTGSEISDLYYVGKLRKLQVLKLDGTNVRDLSPLKSLTNLQKLYLSGTNVRDLSPLKSLTNLQKLYLSGTNVRDLSPLKSLTNLIHLDLRSTKVADVSPLTYLKKITTLDLENTNVKDIKPLLKLNNLKKVRLYKTSISEDNRVVKTLERKGIAVAL